MPAFQDEKRPSQDDSGAAVLEQPGRKTRLPDRLGHALRAHPYSRRTQKAYAFRERRYLFRPCIDQLAIPILGSDVFSIVRHALKAQWKQRKAIRNAQTFVGGKPNWCQTMMARIYNTGTPAEVTGLWSGEIASYTLDALWMLVATALRYPNRVGRPRWYLIQLAGPDDADALLSDGSPRSQLPASLGPVAGLWKALRRGRSSGEGKDQQSDAALERAACNRHSSPRQTAIGILSAAIARLEERRMPARIEGATRQMFAAVGPAMPFGRRLVMANLWLLASLVERILSASPGTNAGIRTTGAATIIEGGLKENVLPGRARPS